MKKFLSVLLCILWMGFIYYNSSQSGTLSDQVTYKVVDKFITIVDHIQEKQSSDIKVYTSPKSLKNNLADSIANKDRFSLNIFLRKGAHVAEFFILAILLCNAFFVYGFKGKSCIIYILFIVLFYAVLDEFHQIYIVERSSSVKDVLIDFIGGIIGVILYYLIYYIRKSMKKVRKN
ncbi:MAG: teicoplanin resistance protein VanZ [Clostridium sp.]|nr:teicoplanin resistance protein VanZ [Clostridium sp.]